MKQCKTDSMALRKRTQVRFFRLAALLLALVPLAACGAPAAPAPSAAGSTIAAPKPDDEPEAPDTAPLLESIAPNVPGPADEIENLVFSFRTDAGNSCVFSLWRDGDGTGCISAAGRVGAPDLMGTIDVSVFDRLQEIVEQNGIAAWDGFSGSDPDGKGGFTLSVTYADGHLLTASGGPEFPEGADAGLAALTAYLTELAS